MCKSKLKILCTCGIRGAWILSIVASSLLLIPLIIHSQTKVTRVLTENDIHNFPKILTESKEISPTHLPTKIKTISNTHRLTSIHNSNVSAKELTTPTKYISLCRDRLTGYYRTGNHMFFLSALIHIARVTGRTLVMPKKGWYLDTIFHIDVLRFDNVEKKICPCKNIATPKFDYDKRFEDQKFVSSLNRTKESILFCSFAQTFQYVTRNEQKLRNMFKFHDYFSYFADSFLKRIGNSSRVKIGVHVRRGDFLEERYAKYGLTVADKNYYNVAFQYFVNKYGSVNFIVTSDDLKWSQANLPNNSSKATIIYSVNNTAAVDLAILSKCDGIIISTGSFGWWAAWLTNKTTVYYNEWPRKGSGLSRVMSRKSYFPPHWIPLYQ